MIHRPNDEARAELARIDAAIEEAKKADGPDYIFLERFHELNAAKMDILDNASSWEDV